MGQHQEQPRAVPRLTVLGIAARLLAGAAVVGVTIYVLVNGLYIEFYDVFGVRPEDVGLDRLAILGRSAWVALVAIALVGLVGYINAMANAEARVRASRLRPEANPKPGGRRLSEQQLRRLVITPISLAIASLLTAGLVIFVFGRFERAIENEVDHVRQGETVNGISLLVPFVDVRATRAEITWLGDERREHMALLSPHLLYLGRGDKVAFFVECGHTTVIVPADAVAIHLLDRGTGNADEVRQRERRQFNERCEQRS